MKKIFFALAAMAVMSCVKDERDPQSLVPAPDPVYDYSGLVLNELSGAGEDNEKFFELYNGGTEDVGLKGVYINKDEELTWTGEKGQVIKAGEVFAIIGAKGTTDDGFSSGFSAKKTVIVELFAPDGTKLDAFQRGEKGSGWGGSLDFNNPGSWSRIPNGKGEFVVTPTPTPGAVNDGTGATPATDLVDNKPVAAPAAVAKVVLNELNGVSKFIELYNAGNAPASLEGWTMYKDGNETPNWTGAAGVTIAAGAYLVLYSEDVAASHSEVPANLIFASGLSAKKTIKIELKNEVKATVDVFTRGNEPWNVTISGGEVTCSFARTPNGTGEFTLADETPGAANGDSKGDIPE